MPDCKACQNVTRRINKRTRTIAFVPDINTDHLQPLVSGGGMGGMPVDYVISTITPKASRHGRSFTLCACDSGHMGVGADTMVVYGATDAPRPAPDELATWPKHVIVALHAGEVWREGSQIDTLIQALHAADRWVVVVPIADVVVHSAPLTETLAVLVGDQLPRIPAEVVSETTELKPATPKRTRKAKTEG